MTSLFREEVPYPMPPAISITKTSMPRSARARAIASPTTPAPTTTASWATACMHSPLLIRGHAVGRRYARLSHRELHRSFLAQSGTILSQLLSQLLTQSGRGNERSPDPPLE